MSLHNSGIQLLPRPSRSLLSVGSEDTRALLPDFATVKDLSQFTNRLFNWHLTVPGIYAQTITVCCFHFLFFIIIGCIMARRFQEGKFWLARVIQRRSGTIIVPNPMLAFLSMAGVYELVFIPFLLTAGKQFDRHTGPPSGIVLFFTLPWLSLAFGLIGAVLGTYFATPDSILDETKALSPFKRFFGQAKVINTLSILGPSVLFVTILVPSIVCNQYWHKAIAMEKRWQLQYSSASSFTSEMVQESQLIWYQALKAHRLASIIFFIWTIVAFTLSIAYCFVTHRLAVAVRRDLNIVKREYSNGTQTILIASSTSSPSTLVSGGSISTLAVQQSASAASPTRSPLSEIQSNKKNLEQALLHIYIQLLAIAPAAAGLGAIALTLALTLFSKLEQASTSGGNEFEACVSGIWLAMMYLILAAASLNVLSVAYKTYEPVFSAAKQNRLMSRSQIQLQDLIKGKAHIKSTFFRTFESSSLSVSSPIVNKYQEQHIDEIGTFDVTVIPDKDHFSSQESQTRTWDIEAKV